MHAQRHVVRRPDGRWEVRERADAPALSRHTRRRQAVDRAEDLLRLHGGGELLIHDHDGRVSRRMAVPSANDPVPAAPRLPPARAVERKATPTSSSAGTDVLPLDREPIAAYRRARVRNPGGGADAIDDAGVPASRDVGVGAFPRHAGNGKASAE
jgi:hypothetical protein